MDDLALAIHQCNSSKISNASSMEGGGGGYAKKLQFSYFSLLCCGAHCKHELSRKEYPSYFGDMLSDEM